MPLVSIKQGIEHLTAGKIIAYPTEAVYGLGCDPNNNKALKHITQIKERSVNKGFIIVGSNFSHLSSYIDSTRPPNCRPNSVPLS